MPRQAESQYDGADGDEGYRGADEAGAVWVSVDRQGRLADVEISTSWRRRLGADRFADALFTAYQAAARKAADANPAGVRYALTLPAVPDIDPDADVDTWLTQSRAALRALDERLAEVSKANALARARLADARTVRGPNGYVTLQVRGGNLIGVIGAAAGLKTANPAMVREDVLGAFRSADLAAGR